MSRLVTPEGVFRLHRHSSEEAFEAAAINSGRSLSIVRVSPRGR